MNTKPLYLLLSTLCLFFFFVLYRIFPEKQGRKKEDKLTRKKVVWKITPQFAEWISQPPIKNETETETKKQKQNPLWSHFILSSTSTIVELGCGISGLVGLALAPSVKHYLATDQEYVRKLFWENVYLNAEVAYKHHHPSQRSRGVSHGKKQRTKHKHDHDNRHHPTGIDANINISFTTLDWETDIPSLLKDTIGLGDNDNKDKGFDLLISCDCIYNEALTRPFLRTCAEICRLRPIYTPTDTDIDTNSRKSQPHRQTQKQSESESSANADVPLNPTICVIAQHLRSPEVFETWLREALEDFRVWRVRDEVLSDGLRGGTGNVVHLLALRWSLVIHLWVPS